ncbi:MAG TPA: hypothetical protein VHY22_00225 [Chthoniobacteraceae bacterium]|jgi:hypothetical protein|nr:hypothetical protein [Chthoniobacteraceae bacterium]
MQWNFYLASFFAGVALLFSLPSHAGPSHAASPSPGQPPYLGLWVWQEMYIENPASRDELLSFCRQQKINRLLLQIHFATDGKIESPASLSAFLAKAAADGIAVEALEGAPDMGLASQRADTLRKLAVILEFNGTQPQGRGFGGVHYDIEPYLTARWKGGGERDVALETLATMQAIREKAKEADPSMTVAYDIPSWYDRKPALAALNFNGRTENFQQQIQDLSDYVGVMSYRRQATGQNSIVAISAAALQYAAKTGKKACPAFETNSLKDDPQISFFGTSPDALDRAIDETREACGSSPGFGGILIHDYRGLSRLLAATAPDATGKPSASN